MRLVFISSVTAMTPLRTISVTTGSMRRSFARVLPVSFLALLMPSPHAHGSSFYCHPGRHTDPGFTRIGVNGPQVGCSRPGCAEPGASPPPVRIEFAGQD